MGFRFAAREELERDKKGPSLAGSRIGHVRGEGLGRTWVRDMALTPNGFSVSATSRLFASTSAST